MSTPPKKFTPAPKKEKRKSQIDVLKMQENKLVVKKRELVRGFILDIVPLTKIPMTRDPFFCYLSEEKLPSGSLVEVPLFRKKVEGIVIGQRNDFDRRGNIHPHTNSSSLLLQSETNNKKIGVGVNLKKIGNVLEESFLTPEQLELARFISDYYISPLGIVMKSFVPKRAKLRKVPSPALRASSLASGRGGIVLTLQQQKAVSEIVKSDSKLLLFGPSGSGKTEVYINAILKLKSQKSNLQFLILLPEKTLTPQALERYGEYFKPEEIVVLSSNISKGKFYAAWQRIKSGEAKIIIGTRMAVFAPFKKLGLVVIDEEQDMSYKNWDMNPRYDARTVAEKLAERHKCPIVRGSATPSVETYWQTENKELKLLKLSPLPSSPIPLPKGEMASAIIVDMRRERWQKNYSPISKKLQSEISYALKNKLQTILFINRQGMSSFSICASCRTVLRCPKCDRALVYDVAGHYRCLHCSYKTSIVPQCSKCRGIVFQNLGLGTQKVEKEIVNLFPQARVERVDSQTTRGTSFQEKIHPRTKSSNLLNATLYKTSFGVGVYHDFSDGKIDILIGTQMISKGWDLPNMALIGIIDADNMLAIPDFNVGEKCYQSLVQVSGRVSRPGAKFPGVVIIQTFQPENRILKMAAQKDFDSFYNQEIKERKELNLPPFGRLIKLTFQEYNLERAEAETKRAYKILQTVSGLSVTSPQNAFVSKLRGRFRKQLIIKFKKDIPAALRRILKMLPQGWIIDVDPISIL